MSLVDRLDEFTSRQNIVSAEWCKLLDEVEKLQEQNKILIEALEFLLPIGEQMFPKDIPSGLSPMFYHTLSYDGDMKVRERLDNIANFLAKYRGNRE